MCLEPFLESAPESFTKTECYHYFHCHCLLRHIEIAEREIVEAKSNRPIHERKDVEDEEVRKRTNWIVLYRVV